MKQLVTLLALLGATGAACPTRVLAQCHAAFFPTYTCHHQHRDSCAVSKPFVPIRLGGSMGLLGASDQAGARYLGAELEAHYWLRPRWSAGLRGSVTGEMPAPSAPAEVYAGATQPRLLLFSATWHNQLLLAESPRWRVAAEVGAGLGGASLYDKAQQVQQKGQGCGCTTAKRLDTAVAPVTEVGLMATYKLKRSDGPWLTVRGGHRQWHGSAPFGTPGQFSAYLLSVGVSVPDLTHKR
ncbi:hypothetical protein [Hymenobacter properus]|uniref:Outer membrane protein beta-barrel domain-containing protein n=1 Tax=Hymenobacter properus TaxID=2791026 RepID=A0A931BG63_9BACT|nr:hypothetical protein [Hymenobacter properus]MBF9142894.1 hypothetical protein [Hymenobacter properus]MBR7721701.1 hypothetical protein [Microvirga sp. SRT04]